VTSVTASPATGASTGLAVQATDVLAGELGLTYTWMTTGMPPAPVLFSANGTNGAKNTTATFTEPGTYSFVVIVSNAAGVAVAGTTSVTVNVSVAGRYLFYSGSAFDTTNDASIATDKAALLPFLQGHA